MMPGPYWRKIPWGHSIFGGCRHRDKKPATGVHTARGLIGDRPPNRSQIPPCASVRKPAMEKFRTEVRHQR
jgi:hypothetical protein